LQSVAGQQGVAYHHIILLALSLRTIVPVLVSHFADIAWQKLRQYVLIF